MVSTGQYDLKEGNSVRGLLMHRSRDFDKLALRRIFSRSLHRKIAENRPNSMLLFSNDSYIYQ